MNVFSYLKVYLFDYEWIYVNYYNFTVPKYVYYLTHFKQILIKCMWA